MENNHPATQSTVALTAASETSLAAATESFSSRSAALAVELVAFKEAGGIENAQANTLASSLRVVAKALVKDICVRFKEYKADAQKVHKNAVAQCGG